MKKLNLTIFLSFFLISLLFSQADFKNESHIINWQTVQSWHLNNSVKKVISFQSAIYPNENSLPYFHKRIAIENPSKYQIKLSNEVYISLTDDERKLIESESVVLEKVQINSQILQEGNSKYFDIQILPFIKKDNQFLKLKSFYIEYVQIQSAKSSSSQIIHTFAANSVLKQGKFVKIRIENSGIHKLSFEDLNSMGINPANVKIFGYGGGIQEQNFSLPKIDDLPELSIHMEKGSDGVFNAGDYVLFYTQGIQKWTYDSSRGIFTHQINHYSKSGYYFVTSDVGVGKKIESKNPQLSSSTTVFNIVDFNDFAVHENDLISIAESGKEFYGENFLDNGPRIFNFNFPNILNTAPTKVRLDVAAASTLNTNFDLALEGNQNKSLIVYRRYENDQYEKAKAAQANYVFTAQKSPLVFSLTYSKPNQTSDGYLNYLEINCKRALKMVGAEMSFQNIDNLGTTANNQFKLLDANANVQIWDITDLQNISKIQTTNVGGTITFLDDANTLKRYLAIDPTVSTSFLKPTIVGAVPNQNLHALPQSEFVILTHPRFVSQAEKLAQAHREIDNMKVAVVTTDQVFNEFSSGTPDATAYRWLMKMFYDRALTSGKMNEMPKYLLLFGKGSYDNRKIYQSSGENLILTYQAENSLVTTQSYTTDDYFAFLDNNEGTQLSSNLLDIAVGRFTVSNTEEATDVVEKTIEYMRNTKKGKWKNQLCFLADDGDGALHMRQADDIANFILNDYPGYYVNKIYLDAYLQEKSASGDTYPLARTKFHNLLSSGTLLLNYTGHAGPTGWGDERILTNEDVATLSNKNLPLWIGATCDFVMFDKKDVAAGEKVVLNRSGGGIGIVSATRPVYSSQNFNFNKLIIDNLFKKENGEHLRIGQIITRAKNNVGPEINKLAYVYLGDPAVKLNYPTNYKVITKKINESNAFGNDTLKALSVITIQGNIVDDNGNINTAFNGELNTDIYDKVQKITTLNNHNDGAFTFSDRVNVLFSGKSEVKNGVFTIKFMMPKDIKYNYGSGRINYYAHDTTTGEEAHGNFENFIVGGTNQNVINDNEGPKLELYLNSDSFVSGDQVNETPQLIVKIEDDNGINTVGSGIGHDLMLTIDKNPLQSYVVNDNFEALPNEFSKGIVRFKIPKLKEGKHTLSFRAWDMLNNSSIKELNFEVIKGLTPQIFKISNYPNPVKNETRIVVDHDRPETILNTLVEIFDLAGRKVWSFKQTNADDITWNLNSTEGFKVRSGIYLYRVSISTSDSDVYSKTNKMLILE